VNEDGAIPATYALDEIINVPGGPVGGLNDEIFGLGKRMIATFSWILRGAKSIAR
jgi:hypothetical protein